MSAAHATEASVNGLETARIESDFVVASEIMKYCSCHLNPLPLTFTGPICRAAHQLRPCGGSLLRWGKVGPIQGKRPAASLLEGTLFAANREN